jgi:hypothetical protein
MGTATRYYGSGNTGSGVPTLANEAGDLTDLIDACLIGSGFGQVTLTALTNTSTTATATVSGGHGFLNKQVVTVSGANETEYNGTFRITVTSATEFTYVMSSAPSGSGTGTIVAILPAVGGWQKLYSGTNKNIYNSTDVSSSGLLFRIDDTGTTSARIVGYESATGVDNDLTNPFPTAAQISGGGYFLKSSSATTRSWWLVADPKCVWFATSYDGSAWHIYGFGDFASLYAGDVYNAFVMCANGTSVANSAYATYFYGASFDQFYVARNNASNVGGVRTPKRGMGGYSGYGATSFLPNYTYPSPTGVDLLLSQSPIIIEEYQSDPRGTLFGMVLILNKYSSSATAGEVRVGVSGYDDGLIILRESHPVQGCLAFDLADWG